jgi:hypothetical protein
MQGDNGIPMTSRVFFSVKGMDSKEEAMFFHKVFYSDITIAE